MELQKHTLAASAGDYGRDVWFHPAPSPLPHSLCLFLDAEHYLRDIQSLPLLEELLQTGQIPSVSLLFVSHVSGADRHVDYTCNERYAQFIAEDALGWALENDPALSEDGHTICGLSLSGLAAAHLAFRYPARFPRALCQSGSFWWLADHEVEFPAAKPRMWMSVGDQETATDVSHPPSGLHQRVSQIEGVESVAERFRSLGATVRCGQYDGGHAIAPWRAELPEALAWLFAA